MIKRITMLVRKDGMTRAAFRDYWHDNHGKIVLQMPAVAAYLQNPVREEFSENIGDRPPFQFDGIVELWFADEAAQQQAFASPAAKLLPKDEPNFIKGITILSIEEELLLSRPGSTKVFLVLDAGPSLRGEERTRTLRAIENAGKSVPGIQRMVANRVTSNGRRDGLWAEPTAPDLILELQVQSPISLKDVIKSAGFDALRQRVSEIHGRLAVRLVEERRVI